MSYDHLFALQDTCNGSLRQNRYRAALDASFLLKPLTEAWSGCPDCYDNR